MRILQKTLGWLMVGSGLMAADEGKKATDAPFFDPTVCVHGSSLNTGSEVVARALLVRLGEEGWYVFDQDLLRPVGWLDGVKGDPVTPEMMAQSSWQMATRKSGAKFPAPLGKLNPMAPVLPGVALRVEDLLADDERPEVRGDAGRGSLWRSGRIFKGYRLGEMGPVLSYECGGIGIEEIVMAGRDSLQRSLRIAPGEELWFLLGEGEVAATGAVVEERDGVRVARVAAGESERRVDFLHGTGRAAAARVAEPTAEVFITSIRMDEVRGPGWTMDRIGLPEDRKTQRRVRPADIVFKTAAEAYVVTFEGDVWRVLIEGGNCRWQRFAAGLSEPLSIEWVDDGPQIFSRHGLIRPRDRDGDGIADDYVVWNSTMMQSQGGRAYPLDMEVDGEGNTWVSFGGIDYTERGLTGNRPANPHAGAILKVPADGSEAVVVASHAREPFFGRDPETGRLGMTDQQGHWIPSSGFFPVSEGQDFGFGLADPPDPPRPAVWIPHNEDSSSASPLWVRGSAFKEWEGGVLDVSYGNGTLLLVRPHGEWPARQGAVMPLKIDTGLPMLSARVNPGDGSIWLAGFRVYDSRAPELEGLGRLRPGAGILTAPVNAELVQDGVVLTFAAPLDPASVKPEKLRMKSWQYQRSAAYGSPRFREDGEPGTDPVASGEVILSKDGRSVFVHVPGLKETMQLEAGYEFAFQGGQAAGGTAYFTVAEPEPMDWLARGFDEAVPDGAKAVVQGVEESGGRPSVERGREVATLYGCIACHAAGPVEAGHSGPSWVDLYGTMRELEDGSRVKVDDAYLRESILDPGAKVVKGYAPGMASYAGVLDEGQLESVILFIQSLGE